MSESTLEIKIKALVEGMEQIQAAAEHLGGVTQAGEDLGKAGPDMASAFKGAGAAAGDLIPELKSVSESVGSVKSLFVGLGETLLALAGIKLSFDFLKDAAEGAADEERLGIALKTVGAAAGYSSEELEGYEHTLTNLGIAEEEAKAAMTKMIQTGLAIGPAMEGGISNVELLGKAAQDLSVVTGKSISDTFGQLTTSIERMMPRALKMMGINIDLAAATKKYSEEIGAGGRALTQQEKIMAVNNAVLGQTAALAGTYAAAQDTAAVKAANLKTAIKEQSDAIGKNLLPMYGAAIDVATTLVKKITDQATGFDKSGEIAKEYASGLTDAFSGIGELFTSISAWFLDLVAAAAPLGDALGGAVNVVAEFVSALVGGADGLSIFQIMLQGAAYLLAAVVDGMALMGSISLFVIGATIDGWGKILEVVGEYAGYLNKEVGDALVKAGNAAVTTGERMVGSANKMYQPFLDGTTHLQKAMDDLAASADATGPAFEKMAPVTTLKEAQEQVSLLTKAVSGNKISADDAALAAETLRTQIATLAGTAGVSAASIAILTNQLNKIDTDQTTKLAADMAVLGMSIDEAITGVPKKFGDMAASLGKAATEGGQALEVIGAGFVKLLSSAQTLAEFGAISNTLAAWKQAAEDYSISAEKAAKAGNTDAENSNREKAAAMQAKVSEALGLSAAAYTKISESSIKAATSQEALTQDVLGLAKALAQHMVTNEQYTATLAGIGLKRAELERTAGMPETLKGLASLGIGFTELTTGISATGTKVKEAFAGIATDSKLTGGQLYTSFEKGISMVKTMADLQAGAVGIKEFSGTGKIMGQEMASSLDLIAIKFTSVFDTQLKAAKTKEDFALLKNEVGDLGKTGTISGDLVSLALDQIREKMSGAREEAARLAKQETDAMNSMLSVATSQLQYRTSLLDVSKAEGEVAQANLQYENDGTEASKLNLGVKKAQLEVANQQAELANAKLGLEVQLGRQQLADQAALNAVKKSDLDQGNSDLAAAAAAATKKADAESLATENIKQQVVAQQANVVAAQDAELAIRGQATAAARAANSSGKQLRNTAGEIMQVFTLTNQYAEGMYRGLGLSAKEAIALASDVEEKFNTRGPSDWFNYGGINKFNESLGVMRAAIEADKAAAEDFNLTIKAAQDQSTYLSSGIAGIGHDLWDSVVPGAHALRDAMDAAALSAVQVLNSAKDAVDGFLKSTTSIHEELLKAQGKTQEAADSALNTRKQELKLQYTQLDLQIRIAEVQAKAAGVNSDDLRQAAEEAKAAYAQAVADLASLAALDKQRLDAAAAAAKNPIVPTANNPTPAAPALSDALAQQSTTASSSATLPNPAAVAPGTPAKVIQLNLTLGSKTVATTIPASSEQTLLDMLATLQKSA